MTWVFIGVIAFAIIFHFVRKNSKKYDDKVNSTRICYHTELDCENCYSYGRCNQYNGPGLVHTRGDT